MKNAKGHIKTKTIKTAVSAAVIMGIIILIGIIPLEPQKVNSFPDASKISAEAEDLANEIVGKKVQVLKDEVLNNLKLCESGGLKEADGYVRMEHDGLLSWGPFQYRRHTIIHYAKKLLGKDIGMKEAALIAFDVHPEIGLEDFTRRILFETERGVWEWENCAKLKGLAAEIAFIKKLAK